MYARVTQFEIDLLRLDADTAIERFRVLILPVLEDQPGYLGVYALLSPDGKGELLSFWQSEAAAEAGIASGYYGEQVAKFVTFFRAPPGREQYAVVLAEGRSELPVRV